MGQHSKIDWCDATWNPVTGCLHGCEYCYARKIANRFAGEDGDGSIHELDKRMFVRHRNDDGEWNKEYECAYPYNFDPTFHRYRLDEPQKWKKPKTIFVCSMADLFGEWVPDEWIKEVFDACEKAPWHRYIFLTKNPQRYIELTNKRLMPAYTGNMWFGSSTPTMETGMFYSKEHNTFSSIEPILEPFEALQGVGIYVDWIIVGAETGNRIGKVIPKPEWIFAIEKKCREYGVPLFMKESLREIMGDDFKQEFPWEVKK